MLQHAAIHVEERTNVQTMHIHVYAYSWGVSQSSLIEETHLAMID